MFKNYNMNKLVLPLDLEVTLQKKRYCLPCPPFSRKYLA